MNWWVIWTVRGKLNQSAQVVQAAAKPAAKPGQTVMGPYPDKAAANAAVQAGGPAGTPPVTGPAPSLNPLSGIAAVGDFFGRLSQANTWIRVAEVLLGAALLIIGLAKLASGTQVGHAAAGLAKKAALA
jgi:hypothetical protein